MNRNEAEKRARELVEAVGAAGYLELPKSESVRQVADALQQAAEEAANKATLAERRRMHEAYADAAKMKSETETILGDSVENIHALFERVRRDNDAFKRGRREGWTAAREACIERYDEVRKLQEHVIRGGVPEFPPEKE